MGLEPSSVSLPGFLTFIRLTAFFVSSPFPGRLVPPRARLIIAAGLSWGFSGTIPGRVPRGDLIGSLVLEIALGLAMGLLLSLVMHAFAYAGEVASQQMGLRMPGFANPLSSELSLLGSAFAMIMLGFFAIGPGPLRLTAFLYRMFELLPVGHDWSFPRSTEIVITAGAELFAGAFQVGAPLITAVFAAQLVLAVLAKSVPTLNLFIEGPALTTGAGIIGLIATVNTFAPLVDTVFIHRFEQLAAWFSS